MTTAELCAYFDYMSTVHPVAVPLLPAPAWQPGDLIQIGRWLYVPIDASWGWHIHPLTHAAVLDWYPFDLEPAGSYTVLAREVYQPDEATLRKIDRLARIAEYEDNTPVTKLQTIETTDRRGETVYEVRMSA